MIIETTDADFNALIEGGIVAGYPVAVGGIESVEVLSMLRNLANNVRAHFSPAAWLIAEDSIIVGLCSLLAPPDGTGSVPIGYGIAPAYQGQGLGAKAIYDLAAWARRNNMINTLTAETATSNIASQKILESNGFIRVGTRNDAEDGNLFCWHLQVT
jgi:RimJ/RimL family protein N-acetyltransferase